MTFLKDLQGFMAKRRKCVSHNGINYSYSKGTMTPSIWPKLARNKVDVLQWPNQSPDLKRIENVGNDLKVAVQRKPTSLYQLEQFFEEAWRKITYSKCTNLVERPGSCNCCPKCLYQLLLLEECILKKLGNSS